MFPGNSGRYVSRTPSRLPAAGSGARFVIDRKAAGSVSVPKEAKNTPFIVFVTTVRMSMYSHTVI
jgi:hypothetical protein